MDLNEYQDQTAITAMTEKMGIPYLTLALNGEAGEVAEKVKKVIRDGDSNFTPEHKAAIAKECGDVLWYLARLAAEAGYTLDQVAEMNLEKLRGREERKTLRGSGDDR